jgi:hypothetical protein
MKNKFLRFRLASFVVAALLVTAHESSQTSAAADDEDVQPNAATKVPDTEEQAKFYQPDEVQTVRIQIAENDLRRLHAALPKRIYVPGSFQWKDKTVNNVGIRFKGNSSSNPGQRHKRSFLIKFNEYEKGQRFLGLKRASLDNGVQFGSLFSETIITDILRDQGLKTHRANYAKLFLNGKYHGVYVNIERVDQTFVNQHLPDKKGALFKIDLGGPGANLQFQGDQPAAYDRAFELKSKSAKNDRENLVDFIRLINQPPKDDFAKQLESKMDLDAFLKVTPTLLFSGAFDQLTGWNAHNYYLYHDLKQDRWLYMPWDLDVAFCEVAFRHIYVLEDWNAAWPVPGVTSNPLLERITADPELLKRYRQSAKTILEKYFEPERLSRVIDSKYALIKDDIKTDPFPHIRATNPEDKDFESIVESMKVFVRKRYATAKKQLNDPGQRPEFVRRRPPNRPNNQPQPGKASDDAPTKLAIKQNAANGVVLIWKDNAKGEAGHILQRASGDNGPFQNYKGQPGDNITQATDRNIRPGQTYRYRVYALHATPLGPKGTGVSNVVTVKVPARQD